MSGLRVAQYVGCFQGRSPRASGVAKDLVLTDGQKSICCIDMQ